MLSCFILSCNQTIKKEKPNPIKKQKHGFTETEQLEKEFLVGDFNGDKQIDTLKEVFTAGDDDKVIRQVTFSYPKEEDYEYKRVDYYFKNNIALTLKSNNPKINELDLGTCYGTYCLINLGDINKDGKDEIALTIAYCDFSLLNSCKIYGYCKNEWVELQQFNVNENSFSFAKDEAIDRSKIREYLEKKDGKWYYMDYFEWFDNDSKENPTPMRPLKVKKCN